MPDMITQGLHGCSREEEYVWPTDPKILQKLEWFQDQKLAFMTHFGMYSQIGLIESWPLSDEDATWSRTDVDWERDGESFRKQYAELNKSFNPVRLMPEIWAQFAADAGFKYFILTTKHHDGFCLFDTKYTGYKTTDPSCPFHRHRYADIVRHLFDAFRGRGLGIGAYFSKPDWHCPWYWAQGMDRPIASDRNPTYTPSEHPALWEKFIQFTHGQMMELVEGYGKLDILWLDGGQVNPNNGQDIRLHELVARARAITPDLLVADRTIGGEFENYITPEQAIPGQPVRVPWESCVTIGTGFSYRYSDQYKSSRTLTHMLLDTVSRGGNLALNIGPQPDGRLPKEAVQSALGLGAWLKVNGEAIYGTRICAPYAAGRACYTCKGDTAYAMIKYQAGERVEKTVCIPWDAACNRLTLLGQDAPIPFAQEKGMLIAQLPKAYAGTEPYALAFRIER
ncbi:MAG: alpha-L-fucosidase [Clostridia bacterium]|nr:alpha-L-fucosidase [Clostridia bacterium]